MRPGADQGARPRIQVSVPVRGVDCVDFFNDTLSINYVSVPVRGVDCALSAGIHPTKEWFPSP